MAKYILTHKAVEDLSNIWAYTFEVWSEAQADKYYYLLLGAFQELADEKTSGKKYPEVKADLLGHRIGQQIIFYRKSNDKIIEIARILHSRMDLKNRMHE